MSTDDCKPKKTSKIIRPKYELNSYGNARRLVDLYGDDIHYCASVTNTGWFIWNDKIWAPDDAEYIYQLAKNTVELMYNELPTELDSLRQRELLKFIIKSRNQRPLEDMVKSSRNEPGIFIAPSKFDTNKDLLTVLNGTIDLRNGELKPFQKELLISKMVNCNYNPDAKCPIWDEFITQICPDSEVQLFLQRFFGYCITGHTKDQVFLIAHGSGGNGKGTMMNTLINLIGTSATAINAQSIMKQKYGRTGTNDMAELYNMRFVLASETDFAQVLDEGRIKVCTGEDSMKARFLYHENFTFTPQFKVVLMTNHEPIIEGGDYSIWRRIIKVNFTQSFKGTDVDPDLKDKLATEYEGILNWLITGAINWYITGLNIPETVRLSTEAFKEDQDVVGDFIDVCLIRDQTENTTIKDLHQLYSLWCEHIGIDTCDSKNLSVKLSENGIDSAKVKRQRVKIGIRFNDEFTRLFGGTNTFDISGGRRDAAQSLFVKSYGETTCKYSFGTPASRPHSLPDSDLNFTLRPQTAKSPQNGDLSQAEIWDTLHLIRLDWYPTGHPKDPSLTSKLLVNALKSKCLEKNYELSEESAKRYVKEGYLAWNWPTY